MMISSTVNFFHSKVIGTVLKSLH